MRFKISFTKPELKETETKIPIDEYQTEMVRYIHRVLGKNNPYHDTLNTFSVSTLQGTKRKGNQLIAINPHIFIASNDTIFIKDFINKVYLTEDFIYGMKLLSVDLIKSELLLNNNSIKFFVKSPILLKESVNNKTKYYTFRDDETKTSEMMKKLILKKADKLKVKLSDFNIKFDSKYLGKKVKLLTLKSVKNFCSVCPVIIETNDLNTAKFIYDTGIGHSTSCGFGYLQ